MFHSIPAIIPQRAAVPLHRAAPGGHEAQGTPHSPRTDAAVFKKMMKRTRAALAMFETDFRGKVEKE